MKIIKRVLPIFFGIIVKSWLDELHALFCRNEAFVFCDGDMQSGQFKIFPMVILPIMTSNTVFYKKYIRDLNF
jgi:hypothetical protein